MLVAGGSNMNPILAVESICKSFGKRVILNSAGVWAIPGKITVILGRNGCGKTTLLTVLGLLRRPTKPDSLGRFSIWVDVNGERQELDLKDAWHRNRQRVIETSRRNHMGFALQSGELLPVDELE